MRGRWRARLAAGLVAAVGWTGLVVPAAPARAAELPPGGMTGAALTTLFDDYGNTSGRWSGADSTASVALPDGRVAWLFSDTMLGTVNADFSRPRTSPMINNSAVVQDGAALTSTVHGGTTAAPQSLIPSGVAGEWYWVADATVEGGSVRALVNRYKRTGTGSLDVALTGTALATLALPGLTPTAVTELPLGNTVAWGAAVLEDGPWTYVYGSEYVAADNQRFARLARVPAGGLAGAWQFWTGTGWSGALTDSARLPLSGVGTAFGVQRVGDQYVIVTVQGNVTFGSQVVAYTAAAPTGPFSGPVDLFTAGEPAARQGVIVYDARLHPELAQPGKLLVSYNVHSLNADDLYTDARIYRPRFVDVTWPQPVPDPALLPAAPADLTATTDPTGAVHLSWPAVTGTGVSYEVHQRDVTAGQTHFARVAQPTGTTADLGGTKTGHTYEYRVFARNSTGVGQPSPTRSVVVTIAPPPAPANLAATAGTDGSVRLTWSAVPYAWRYDVQRRDVTAGETEFAPVNDDNPADTTVTANWLTKDHEYEFVVTASHGGGESPRSAPVRATVRYAVPAAPTNLTATARTDGQIDLAWQGPASGVHFLVGQRDVTAGETTFTELPLPITTCCTMTAGYLTNGHEYEFTVTASNLGGDSTPSNTARATSTYPKPSPPGTLTAVAGDGQVQLTWGASATPDAWYWVYQRDVTAGETQFTQLPLPITSCCTMTAGYLANGHTYEFKVTTTAQGGESTPTNLVQATPRRPLPGQVTGLTATALSDGGIKLNWTKPGDNLYYWVYQRDVTAGQTAFTKLAYPVPTCCTFTAGLLTHNHVYEFKVAANNETGDGPASAAVRATAFYQKPAAPTGLTAKAAGDGSIDLDWNGPQGIYYWIYLRDVTAGQTAFTRSFYPTDKTSASWGSLVNGHVYEFKVTGENSGGEGPASATVRATSVGGLPKPPSGLTASAGDGKVTLRWTASATANVYYWIEMRPSGGTWSRLQYPVSTCCSFTVDLLTNGTTYEFRLRANNVSGDSAASNVASARPMPPLPQAPSGLTASAGDGKVTLRWTASPSANVYYWIEMRPSGGTWNRLDYPVSTCCSYTVSLLTNGTTYEFRVLANNLSGDSGATNTASARPMPPLPAPPTSLTATASGDTAAKLSWQASSTGSVYYWIYYRLAGQSTWSKALYPLGTCCTFTMSLLTPGKTYDFQLRAQNLTGYSSASNTASVTLTITAPGIPQDVRAVPQTTSSDVRVSWNAVGTATGYTVETKACRGDSWHTVGFMITSTYATIRYAAGCYQYRVIADRYGKQGYASGGKFAFGTVDDYPWGSGFPWIDRYGFVLQQCTSFVASRVYKYIAQDPPGFMALNYWNANNWDEAAAAHGGMVSHTPAVGAIAQWNGGQYGHVAWVSGIDGSYIIIEEYNYTYPSAYSRRRILASSVDNYLSVM
ncbi:fibronectin type III domain-containing protein [Micromonospora auratinigra]|uniref:Fibronectin type III domain-containing protein n=1 Tax=Micromonospora auratinigra TaxID=261654 RepID=A0A1A9AA05_9ACTN|nr:fibronectin type III domain-containing protein [Micromonospora auratinigra]SBT52933.1 Fibronectin type III domain-containing protein [Micromonospora auratinigra]